MAPRTIGLSDLDSAITTFRAAAVAKGDFQTPTARDHALQAVMQRALFEFDAAGLAGLTALGVIAQDSSPHVRSWAAAELLSRGDLTMVAVLQELVSHGGLLALTANTILKEHHGGRFRSPFGSPAS